MGRYLAYMQRQETAEAFDWWCAAWCIGMACARETYVNRPRAPVYLNMYLILVGDSGIARKTTSITVASKLARSVLAHYTNISLLDTACTPEALNKLLHDRTTDHGCAQLCITVPELAVFLGTEHYIAHMPTLLTELYDCPSAREGGGTIARGEIVQRKVWLHFLSASTPVWLLKAVNPKVIEGGFTSRCYFIISNTPKHSIPWPSELDDDLYQDMCEDLRIIAAEARTRPPIGIREDAKALFSKWYTDRTRSLDPYKQTFESREDAHVLRMAAILCINDGTWEITCEHIEHAVTVIASIKENSSLIFDTAEIRSKHSTALDMIRTALLSAGMDPVPRHRLYLHMRGKVSHPDFLSMLEVLQELGAVQRFDVRGRRGRAVNLIRGTQKLLEKGLGDKVISLLS